MIVSRDTVFVHDVCYQRTIKRGLRMDLPVVIIQEKVHVGKDQENVQSENDSHSKNRGGKNQTNNQALIP